jgi:hypothetical protein
MLAQSTRLLTFVSEIFSGTETGSPTTLTDFYAIFLSPIRQTQEYVLNKVTKLLGIES